MISTRSYLCALGVALLATACAGTTGSSGNTGVVPGQDSVTGLDQLGPSDSSGGPGDSTDPSDGGADGQTDVAPDISADSTSDTSVGPAVSATPCDASVPCSAPWVCDPNHHACVACLTSADCPAGSMCSGHACTATAVCKSDKDCKSLGQVCDEAHSVCVPCTTSADCGDGVCTDNQCIAKQPCKSSKDCPGVCNQDSGQCVECTQAGDCTDGQFCDTAKGKCAPKACSVGSCLDGAWFACAKDGGGWAAPIQCDDNNLCTTDTCGAATGCGHSPGALKCNDGNPCTADSCDPQAGCAATPQSSGSCDDGNPCTIADKCGAGVCAGIPTNCDDGNPCTADTCGASGCVHQNSEGQACDADGSACTPLDTCSGGKCVAGTVKVCPDQGPCVTVGCDAKSGDCTGTAKAGPCSDGDPCTTGETCIGVVCGIGKPKTCDDGNPCTKDSCDPAQGDCIAQPLAGACSDGNPCTDSDACSGGSCVGVPIDVKTACDDGNACTSDACNPSTGCVHLIKAGGSCDDGNPCTGGDVCDASGKCAGPTSTCACTTDSQCAATANPCLGVAYCDKAAAPYACKYKGGTAVQCDASGDTTCAANVCSEATGKCALSAKNEGQPCDDGSACTTSSTCQVGACTGAQPLQCNDGNPCTIDSCDAKSGCIYTPTTGACSDENPCTTGDVCTTGVCKGTLKNCNDGLACTIDLCDGTGTCAHAPKTGTCNDGDPCTLDDACSGGKCVGGTAAVCNDNNPCTTDSCVAGQGCSHTSVADQTACGDKQWCSAGTCVAAPYCGNGKLESGEQCDDGNTTAGDGCTGCVLDLVPAPQPGEVLITEVMARPATAANEWVELYSAATHTVDLNGLYLCDSSFCVKLVKAGGFYMKPGEFAVLAAVDIAASEGAPAPEYVYGYSSNSVSFGNSGDLACLTPDPTCPATTRIAMIAFGQQPLAQSYQLDANHFNAADAAQLKYWCYSQLTFSSSSTDKASPKSVNGSCP